MHPAAVKDIDLRTVISDNFFIKFNGLRGFKKVFRLFIWFCRGLLDFRGKKSLNIGFFMEEGIVCKKQDLAGITGLRTFIMDGMSDVAGLEFKMVAGDISL
ncbi:MAG: hypothetical protein OXD29_11590 [Roseovarius sp.]|nr:hypothetical protein [Roseovarius sp.]